MLYGEIFVTLRSIHSLWAQNVICLDVERGGTWSNDCASKGYTVTGIQLTKKFLAIVETGVQLYQQSLSVLLARKPPIVLQETVYCNSHPVA